MASSSMQTRSGAARAAAAALRHPQCDQVAYLEEDSLFIATRESYLSLSSMYSSWSLIVFQRGATFNISAMDWIGVGSLSSVGRSFKFREGRSAYGGGSGDVSRSRQDIQICKFYLYQIIHFLEFNRIEEDT